MTDKARTKPVYEPPVLVSLGPLARVTGACNVGTHVGQPPYDCSGGSNNTTPGGCQGGGSATYSCGGGGNASASTQCARGSIATA
jgi:hypothetical protein